MFRNGLSDYINVTAYLNTTGSRVTFVTMKVPYQQSQLQLHKRILSQFINICICLMLPMVLDLG